MSYIINILRICYILTTEIIKYIYSKCTGSKYNYYTLTKKIVENNALAVKFFQYSCNNPALQSAINADLYSAMTSYYRNAHYSNNDINYNILSYIKNNYNIDIDVYNPVNSGTVAIVYNGIKDDKKYIIKIKRHNIEKRLRFDYNMIKYLVNAAFNIGLINKHLAAFKDITNSLECIYQQCNFDNEIKYTKMHNSTGFNSHKDIIYPQIYNDEIDSINTEFIIMNYIQPTIEIVDLTAELIHKYCYLLLHYNYNSIYNNTIVHGDLHLGNVIFTGTVTQPKLGIIDFGLVNKITPEISKNTIDILSTDKATDQVVYDAFNTGGSKPFKEYPLYEQNSSEILNELKKITYLGYRGQMNETELIKITRRVSTLLGVEWSFKQEYASMLISSSLIGNNVLQLLEKIYKTPEEKSIAFYNIISEILLNVLSN